MFGIKKYRINPLSGKSRRDLVGIGFGGNNLKLAHLSVSSNKTEVLGLVSRNIAGLADADISKLIASSFQGLGAKNPYIVSAVTSNLAITKNIEIPSIDPKEIGEIINLQAGRHTPYSREEIVIDYLDAGVHKNTYTKILLVIVVRNVIKRQFDIVSHAGLKLEKVFFASEGLASSATKILNVNTFNSPVSIVNIDEGFTDFTVVYKNRLVFVRSIPMGVQQLKEERDGFGVIKFAEELKKSLETYHGENIGNSPDSMILTGATEDTAVLEPVLTETTRIPVRTVDYFKNLIVKGGVLDTVPGVKRLSFLDIIAPLAALEDIKISLIPEEVKIRRSIEERGKDLIKTGMFVFTALILICVTLATNIYFKSAYLKNLTAKYRTLNEDAQKLENSFTMVSFVRNYITNRGYSLEVLAELTSCAPVNLELDDIRFDGEGKISLRGTAESMSTVFSFVEALGKSKYFKDVKTKYTSNKKEGTKDLTDFEITAALNKTHN